MCQNILSYHVSRVWDGHVVNGSNCHCARDVNMFWTSKCRHVCDLRPDFVPSFWVFERCTSAVQLWANVWRHTLQRIQLESCTA